MRTGSVARLFVPRYVRYLTQHRLPRLQGLHITKCPAIWCLSNWKGGVWGGGRGEEGKKRVPTRHWCVCTYFQTTAMAQGDAWTCMRSCQCHRRPGTNLGEEATPLELAAIQMDARGEAQEGIALSVPVGRARAGPGWNGSFWKDGVRFMNCWNSDGRSIRPQSDTLLEKDEWKVTGSQGLQDYEDKNSNSAAASGSIVYDADDSEHRRHQSLAIALVWQ